MTTSLLLALPFALLDAVTNGIQNGTSFALPARSSQLTWQTIFGTAPASVTNLLQLSLDNSNWATIDTSTSTAGEIRTVQVNGGWVRARQSAVSGGSTTTVLLDAKDA